METGSVALVYSDPNSDLTVEVMVVMVMTTDYLADPGDLCGQQHINTNPDDLKHFPPGRWLERQGLSESLCPKERQTPLSEVISKKKG